jgi:uncharacterized protein YndB with AHSA1/START domain
MRGPDGTVYPVSGVYREVVEPERLVSVETLSDLPDAWWDLFDPDRDRARRPRIDYVVTVTFEELGARTLVTVRSRFPSAAIRDAMANMKMVEGWTESLERLAAVLAEGENP